MRVAITGAAGFIGRPTVDALKELGAEVVTVGRNASNDISADLLVRPAIGRELAARGCGTLVHLAWTTEHGKFWASPDNIDWLASSALLVRSFVDSGGRRVVAAGTCVEYDPPASGPCVPGETPTKPATLYGAAKAALRETLAAWSKVAGFPFAWGHVFAPFGVGEKPDRVVPFAIRNLLAGKECPFTSGRQVRDFLDVRDCGMAFAKLALSDVTGAVNVSSGVPTTIAELVSRVGALTGRGDLIRFGALPDRTGEPPNLWGDASRLAATGFSPLYSHDDTIRAMISEVAH
jgi:nucleoside-diphosphate-sugar epimerase